MDPKHKSPTVPQAPDPRVEKTKALIAAAFFQLLGRRSYAAIRVSDITQKAGVGRATFYAHFASKDALLGAELVRVVHPMLVPLAGDPCLVDCTAFFVHLHHARALYRALMGGDSRLVGERIVQAAIEGRVEQIAALPSSRLTHSPVPATLLPRFVSSTLLALVSWSLVQPAPIEAAALQTLYAALAGRGLLGGT